MIRSHEEAKRLRLPPVPAASRAQFYVSISIILLLILACYILLSLAPLSIRDLAIILVLAPFIIMILRECAFLCFARDENGRRIPCTKRIERFKEIYSFHDYSFLIDHGIPQVEKFVKELDISMAGPRKDLQKAVRSHFAQPKGLESIHFHVQQQEVCPIHFYAKDGDPENSDPQNHGVRVKKHGMNKELLRVLVIFDDATKQREMDIPIALIETYAEEYLSFHVKQEDLVLQKIFSHAINQAVIKLIKCEARSYPLYEAVSAGQTDVVRELVQKDIDINERTEFGWTALLIASAHGYPEIVRSLLKAGANPNIGNLLGITPLHILGYI